MAIPTVFTVLWCAGTVWSTVGALSGHCGALCCHVVLHKFVGPPLFAWRSPVSGTVAGQNPAPPHHFTLEGSHSNPRAPSFNVGATPLRRRCRILDLQLVFVFSLWWPQCWRDPSEEVVQDFGPSTCFCFLTVVATMLTRENEGSKKSVRKVVQDFVHQQSRFITTVSFRVQSRFITTVSFQ